MRPGGDAAAAEALEIDRTIHVAAHSAARHMSDRMTFRVLGPHERGRFATEAWGHLLALQGAGMLNAAELEHVIDRALSHIEGRIALDDLRSLIEGPGYDQDGPTTDHATVH